MANIDMDMKYVHNCLCGLVDHLFEYIPEEQVMPLNEPCIIHTWNKGYDFICTGLKKRKGDNAMMMVGTYCGKDATEFVSYVYGYDQDKKFINAIIKTFNL
jgi:hypothetical protein